MLPPSKLIVSGQNRSFDYQLPLLKYVIASNDFINLLILHLQAILSSNTISALYFEHSWQNNQAFLFWLQKSIDAFMSYLCELVFFVYL